MEREGLEVSAEKLYSSPFRSQALAGAAALGGTIYDVCHHANTNGYPSQQNVL